MNEFDEVDFEYSWIKVQAQDLKQQDFHNGYHVQEDSYYEAQAQVQWHQLTTLELVNYLGHYLTRKII